MSKRTHRYTTVVQCDVVMVTETDTDIIHSDQCETKFMTASISAMARGQAKNEKWQRPKVRHVRWPGQPPMEGGKRVDVCPEHTPLIMTPAEYKAAKKAERAAAKAAAPKKKRKPKPKCDGSGVIGWNEDANENIECPGCAKCKTKASADVAPSPQAACEEYLPTPEQHQP